MDNLIEIHSCASEKSIMSFPLGALCVKTAINSNINLPRAVVFEHYIDELPENAASETAKRQPYAVGMSTYIWNVSWFEKFAKELKRFIPDIVLFAGGPQMSVYSSCPDYLDFIVQGEGEISTVKALENNVKGLVKSVTPKLEKLESPFLSGQSDAQLSGTDSVLWELTRGCPFSCAFCFESRGTKIVRDYPFERIEKELDYFIAHDISNVFVLDPTFNLNPERAKKILRLMINNAPSSMHFTFEIRAELLDEELTCLFAELNCSLQIGLQSSDEKVLEAVGRNFDSKIFSEKVGMLAKHGVAFGLDVIIGLPSDTFDKFRKTLDFAVSLMPSNIDIFLLSVLPCTELSEKMSEYNLTCEDNESHRLKYSSTFPEEDIKKALELKNAVDLFFTKGQACMWIHCLLETLNISACNLFTLFTKWMSQTKRSVDEDIWILQDDFVTSLLEKTQNNKLIGAMKSFMELHQGFCYVTDTGEEALLDLSYHPDDLAKLDSMSLSEFVKTVRPKKCQINLIWDENEGVVWRRVN